MKDRIGIRIDVVLGLPFCIALKIASSKFLQGNRIISGKLKSRGLVCEPLCNHRIT